MSFIPFKRRDFLNVDEAKTALVCTDMNKWSGNLEIKDCSRAAHLEFNFVNRDQNLRDNIQSRKNQHLNAIRKAQILLEHIQQIQQILIDEYQEVFDEVPDVSLIDPDLLEDD